MGYVYKVWDRRARRHAVLKYLKVRTREGEGRFLKEGRLQARLRHPRVCQVYEMAKVRGWPYFAMEYVAGQTLRAARPRMTLHQLVEVMTRLAATVHAVHEQGVIHRDLNPRNVLVAPGSSGKGPIPYLIDFGIAHDCLDPSPLAPTLTILGTPSYMAPEQTLGSGVPVDARTDVYGLGATLYELLTGRRPFEGESSQAIISKLRRERPVPLEELAPGLPQSLQAVTLRCLEKDPDRRYPSAAAVAEALEGIPTEILRGELAAQAA